MNTHSKPLSTQDGDVDDEQELDELTAMVIAAGDKKLQAQIEEAVRLGIIDEQGSLLKRELPEDMREGAERDFGG
jgi:hypothetical protein